MIIEPTHIEQSGPGIDLSNQPDGIAIEMSDPVADFEYARNAVTLTFDLSAFETVRLAFKAMEYGDEPHAPPAGPFGDDADFVGVSHPNVPPLPVRTPRPKGHRKPPTPHQPLYLDDVLARPFHPPTHSGLVGQESMRYLVGASVSPPSMKAVH